MIDIHCHILPGVDDGAQTMEDALLMASIAYEDGIRDIVATPHFAETMNVPRELVLRKSKELQHALDEAEIGITIHPGNEVRLESPEYVYEHTKHNSFCYLGQSAKFILLEQRWAAYNKRSIEVIDWFIARGIQPIIPHPERHGFFRNEPALITELVKAGAWTQISVDSMLGKNGDDARIMTTWLLENNFISTIATDAHNVTRRPNLSLGFAIIQESAGAERVQEINDRMKQVIA